MDFKTDDRIVLTLDAGGTNFVFNAVRGGEEILEPHRLKAKGKNLQFILERIIEGFRDTISLLSGKPAAISFCFPGPADYPKGIIGDLANLEVFRGGVALKDMLEDQFGIPVFINNDGNLFTYGEAIAGLLPEINDRLESNQNPKRYHNLFGATFGTGFGGGIVTDGQLFIGDNSTGGEINRMRNKLYPDTSAEESVSIRGVRRVYAREAGLSYENSPNPRLIYEIAEGSQPGNKKAALLAYEEFAIVAGDALANAMTLIDGLVVIGGGLANAHPLILQKMVDEMNNHFKTIDGGRLDRMEVRALNLENEHELREFLRSGGRQIKVPFSDKVTTYNPSRCIGVGVSRLETSLAVSIGAYVFALKQLDK